MASLNLKIDMSHLSAEFVEHIGELVKTTARRDFNLHKLSVDVERAFMARDPRMLECVATCKFLQTVCGDTCQCARQSINGILRALCFKEDRRYFGKLPEIT